jgi:hypothetical protein
MPTTVSDSSKNSGIGRLGEFASEGFLCEPNPPDQAVHPLLARRAVSGRAN